MLWVTSCRGSRARTNYRIGLPSPKPAKHKKAPVPQLVIVGSGERVILSHVSQWPSSESYHVCHTYRWYKFFARKKLIPLSKRDNLIIYGWKVIERSFGMGNFYCPFCQRNCEYNHRYAQRFFHIFWIPLIPLKILGDWVRCEECHNDWKTEAIHSHPWLKVASIKKIQG